MPAESEAQRRYLNMKFGHAWVKRHHFDNKGKLPAHVNNDPPKEKQVSAFSQLAAKLAAQGVKNPNGAAAAIGRKKYGAHTMAEASAKGESVKAVLRQRRGK